MSFSLSQWMNPLPFTRASAVPISPTHCPQPFFPHAMNCYGGLFNFLPSAASSTANPTPFLTTLPSTNCGAAQLVQKSAVLPMKVVSLYPTSLKDAFLNWKSRFICGEIEQDDPEYPVWNSSRSWRKYLSCKWSTYEWTKGVELPELKTLQSWEQCQKQLKKTPTANEN